MDTKRSNMVTEEEEIKSLTALIAKETAAAHEALRLELDNFDDLSLSEDGDVEHDELINELSQSRSKDITQPIGLGYRETVEDSLRLLRGHLSVQEIAFIVKCPPDEDDGTSLQRCMILNRSKRMELLQSYQHYSNLMWKIVCEEKNVSTTPARDRFNQWLINKVAAPYFKVDKGFSHPPNVDVLQMRANGELSIYFVSSGRRRWTIENQANLRGAVRLSHYTNKRMKLERDLKYLNLKVTRCQDEDEKNNYQDQIKNFEEELQTNQENYEKHFPPLGSEEFIDWDDVSIKDLQGKFSAATCKAMWRLYLHPDINNEDWKASEIERVHDIVARNNYQRWEVIATELKSHRSPYLLCIHFFSTLVDRYDRNPFSKEESARLKAIIDKYLIIITNRRVNMIPGSSGYNYIPWAKVARDFGNTRSRNQLYMHYMYRIRDRDNRILGNFSASEDVQILYLVNKYGENFPLIAEHMKRSTVQLRGHYLTFLKSLDSEQIRDWTVDDDQKLIDLVKLFGNRYAMISRELYRTVGSIRGRLITIRRNLEVGVLLKDIPRRRRGHRQIVKRVQSKVMAEALADTNEPLDIAYLRDTFDEKPTRPLGATKLGRPALMFDAVDQQLVSYFKMSAGVGRSFKLRQISDENLNRCAISIRNIFSVLKVTNLNIPTNEELKAYGSGSFDDVDHYLLTLLRQSLKNCNPDTDGDIYLPPNTSSLCALKGLIIGSKSVEGNLKNSELRQLFKNDLEELHEYTRTAVSYDRDIFIERLISILLWPSICSLQGIGGTIVDAEEPDIIRLTPIPPNEPKRKGRPKRDLTKINLMVKARMKERKKRKRTNRGMDDGDEFSDESTSPETSVITDSVELNNFPGTSQQKPRLKISVKQKFVLNKTAATSVEEVNKLLKVGKSMGSTKTLVKVDKKTMEKMQRDRKIRHTEKKKKFANIYVHNRTTRSTVKATVDLNNSTSISKEDSDIDLKIDISKLDSILRSNKSNKKATNDYKRSLSGANKCRMNAQNADSKVDVLSVARGKLKTYQKVKDKQIGK